MVHMLHPNPVLAHIAHIERGTGVILVTPLDNVRGGIGVEAQCKWHEHWEVACKVPRIANLGWVEGWVRAEG